MDPILNTYLDPSNPGSYGGVKRLQRVVKKGNVLKTLRQSDIYTLYKPIRRNFPRRKTIALDSRDLFQMDLVDMIKYKRFNKGYQYILMIIDCFSKVAYAYPIKKKASSDMLSAIKKLFRIVKPKLIQTDEGKEFLNKPVQDLLKKHNIRHYFTFSAMKASIVERLNRTIKTRMWRVFAKRGNYKYLDILPDLIKSYNNSYHRSIGMKPTEVNAINRQEVFERLFPPSPSTKYKYNVGDSVRISKVRGTFDKAYKQNWTDEIFFIHEKKQTYPATYLLRDINNEIIAGSVYEFELQKVEKSDKDLWSIDRILKTRGTGKKKQYFIKWRGYPDKFNSWVSNLTKNV